MKKQLLGFLLGLSVIGLLALKPDDQKMIGTVKVIDGVEIYMQCEPLRPYKVVGDVMPAGMNLHMDSMDHLCEHFINRGRKKDYKFDGIVFQNKWRAYLIQFTN